MSLNEDLPPTVDPELVPPPGTLNAQKDDILLVANTRENPDPSKGLPPEIQENVANMNVQFKSVTDEGEKLIDLQSLEEQIIGDEGMTRVSAESLHKVTGCFYDRVGSAEKFTKIPSSIGRASAESFINNIRLETKKTMALTFQRVIDEPLNRALADLQLVKEVFEPYCRQTCEDLRANFRSAEKPFYESDNVIFWVNGEFLNVFTTDLDRLSEILEKGDNVDLVPYQASVRATKAILDNTKIKGFIQCFNDTKDFTKAFDTTQHASYRGQPFALKDLSDFFASETCCDAIDAFVRIIEDKNSKFEEIKAAAAEHIQNGTMDKFLTEQTPEVSDYLKWTTHFFLYTNDYLLLLNQVKSLFDISQRTFEPTVEETA